MHRVSSKCPIAPKGPSYLAHFSGYGYSWWHVEADASHLTEVCSLASQQILHILGSKGASFFENINSTDLYTKAHGSIF